MSRYCWWAADCKKVESSTADSTHLVYLHTPAPLDGTSFMWRDDEDSCAEIPEIMLEGGSVRFLPCRGRPRHDGSNVITPRDVDLKSLCGIVEECVFVALLECLREINNVAAFAENVMDTSAF